MTVTYFQTVTGKQFAGVLSHVTCILQLMVQKVSSPENHFTHQIYDHIPCIVGTSINVNCHARNINPKIQAYF